MAFLSKMFTLVQLFFVLFFTYRVFSLLFHDVNILTFCKDFNVFY